MGVTALDCRDDGTLVVGSFAGLYALGAGDSVRNLLAEAGARGRPFVTGYMDLPDLAPWATTLSGGIVPLAAAGAGPRLQLPPPPLAGAGMPLKHWVFELHNGRIFRDLVGRNFIWLIPIAGLLVVLMTVAGLVDLVRVLRPRWRRSRRRLSS